MFNLFLDNYGFGSFKFEYNNYYKTYNLKIQIRSPFIFVYGYETKVFNGKEIVFVKTNRSEISYIGELHRYYNLF